MIAALLGVLTTLAFEPAGLGVLAVILILPLFHIGLLVSPRDTGGHFFWYGLGLFLTGTYWIHISVTGFGGAPWWVAMILMVGLALIMSLWLWIAGWLISRFAHGEHWLLLVMAPAAWVLVEWLRGWVLTGFPWLALGYSQIDNWLAGWAPLLGVYGVSFMLVLSSTAILVAILSNPPQRWIALALIVLPWIGGAIMSSSDWTEPDGDTVRTTIVQAGISQDRKWLPEQREPTLNFFRKATRDVPDSELVVWPEVAIPAVVSQVEDYLEAMQADSRKSGQTIALGILERIDERGEVDVYNSVLALDGTSRQVYRKRHLVPYGEYFPVPGFVRTWMQQMNLPYNDLAMGERIQPLIETRTGLRLASAICYEDAYAGEMQYAFPDAGVILNLSNDAWFGDSIAAHQHLQIARMRSVEFGRPTIRATNTGVSAFIDHEGGIVKEGPQHSPVLLTSDVQPRSGATPFGSFGNRPIVVICLVILAFGWLRSRS
jgi:apolipoprotein N-acyltransferase